MKIIDWPVSNLKNIYTIKHICWILSCFFTLGKQYVQLRGTNVKIARLKRLAFAEKKFQDAEQFDGKIG
jgi:hypothetical protein